MGLLIVIVFGVTALILPGCFVLMGSGLFLLVRGQHKKSRKDTALGSWLLLVAFVLLVPALFLLYWLYQAGAFR